MKHFSIIIPVLFITLVLSPAVLTAQVPSGPNVGETIPAFKLPDQNGVERDLQSITGPKGAIILFHRSADW